jgi:hypothetical protein
MVASSSVSNTRPIGTTHRPKRRYLFVSRSKAVSTSKSGATDEADRTLMSLVPFKRTSAGSPVETGHDVLRIWLDKEQTRRLRDGIYMATVVRQEDSCWIRGSLGDVFLMDNADPPEDDPGAAGSFYNKAPRFTVLGSSSLNCKPFK